MSKIEVAYGAGAGGGAASEGAEFEIQYSDGAGGFSATSVLTTDASGNLFANNITSNSGLLYLGSSFIRDLSNDILFYIGSTSASANRITMKQAGALSMGSTTPIEWVSINQAGGIPDVGMIRDSAGVLKVTDGGAGTGGLIMGALNCLTLPNGTLASPPTGMAIGDMWEDTTDSAVHPIIRVSTVST